MFDSKQLSLRLDFALKIALEAGRHTLTHFRQGVAVERKGDASPVTIADRETEQLLRQRIRDTFPDDSIQGEEYDDVTGSNDFRWVLDPIDGTKSFISGVPLYGTLVGLLHQDESVAGVINVPALGECVYGGRGLGAWYLQGDAPAVEARVSDTATLADGTFVTSQVDSFAESQRATAYHALEKAAYITRTWGDCYGYLLVATGRAVAMVDPIMNVWDAAAIQPILEEAGGTFTDWQGKPTVHGGEGIGTNKHVLDEVLKITRK
jgi:histidinol-phosphatase